MNQIIERQTRSYL